MSPWITIGIPIAAGLLGNVFGFLIWRVVKANDDKTDQLIKAFNDHIAEDKEMRKELTDLRVAFAELKALFFSKANRGRR